MLKHTLNFIITFVVTLFVLIGSFFVSYYMYNDITYFSIFLGLLGSIILFPAFKHWENYFKNLLKQNL